MDSDVAMAVTLVAAWPCTSKMPEYNEESVAVIAVLSVLAIAVAADKFDAIPCDRSAVAMLAACAWAAVALRMFTAVPTIVSLI